MIRYVISIENEDRSLSFSIQYGPTVRMPKERPFIMLFRSRYVPMVRPDCFSQIGCFVTGEMDVRYIKRIYLTEYGSVKIIIGKQQETAK